MDFWGILLCLGGIAPLLYFLYILFKEGIYPKHKEKKYARDLFDKVRWIAIKVSGVYGGSIFINDSRKTSKEVRDKDLIDYIINEQCNFKIDNIHSIDISNKLEKDFVCDILDAHKNDVIENLFLDCLTKNEQFYNLDFLEYYMFSLRNFLEKKQLNRDDFNNIVLYDYIRQDGSYRIYELTDYGIIFQKLFYIVTLFCASNKKVKLLLTNPENTLNSVKKNLEDEEITFWSYRP